MNVDDQAQGLFDLEQALAIHLYGGNGTGAERLALFRVSKRLAEVVLKHAACTHLALTLPDSPPPATAATAGAAAAHAETAQQLAAQSGNVVLALHGGLITPAACLWQSITILQLHNIKLNQSSSDQLQLHRLPRLHTLSLQHCRIPDSTGPSSSTSSSSSQRHRSTSVRTLECRLNSRYGLPFALALQWVDPSQLQTVITNHIAVTTHLPQMPALQELRICTPYGGSTSWTIIEDESFQQLLAHPRLSRVQLGAVHLFDSHADTPCAWDSLQLTHGVHLDYLARMPLGGIRSCTVHGCLAVNEAARAAAASSTLSHAQRLVFQPSPDVHEVTPTEPTFVLGFDESFNDKLPDAQQISSDVTTLSMRCLIAGGLLTIVGPDLGSPGVRSSLAAAPATLTRLAFQDWTASSEALPGVMTLMPHVKQAILLLPTWL